jgi:hypothetical protein
MKSIYSLFALMSLLVIPSSQAQSTVKAIDPLLQAAIDARQKAVDNRNAAEWAKFTADEFIRINPDGSIVGRAEQMKALAINTNRPNPLGTDKIQMFGPDAAVVTFQSRSTTGSGINRITSFWIRQNGNWKVAVTVFTPYTAK